MYDREEQLEDNSFANGMEDDISDESLSKWPPSGEQKNSLNQGLYTSFNKDIFHEKSDKGEDLWSSLEYPPSPKDAFRETCEFYGDPVFSKRKYSQGYEMNGGIPKLARVPKPKKLDFYKSDSKLAQCHYESSSEEMENFSNPMGRSKSLHDLQLTRTSSMPRGSMQNQKKQSEQIGLSEHDLNRARSGKSHFICFVFSKNLIYQKQIENLNVKALF